MDLIKFLKSRFIVKDSNFKFFYTTLFYTTLLPYIPYFIPIFPREIGGFNLSGYAWVMMFLCSLVIFLYTIRLRSFFPHRLWLIWVFYISFHLFFDYSFIGLQLTLQYALPILAGVIAGRFRYDDMKIKWLLQRLLKTTLFMFLLFIISFSLTSISPFTASTPMYLIISGCISIGMFYELRKVKYILLYFLLFLVPLLSVTRMAILVYLLTIVVHFSNKKILNKIFTGLLSLVILISWVNSESFQEKTFHNGEGNIFQSGMNYKNNLNINTNGRTSWAIALEPGLKDAPWFGNGPRADGVVVGALVGLDTYETHNDYLSLRYNYGIVGLSLFLITLMSTFRGLWRIRLIKYSLAGRILHRSTLTLFIILLLFMYSDNIMKYTTWYTNYLFVAVGICFSLNFKNRDRKSVQNGEI